MTTKKVTLINNFHSSEVNVLVPANGRLTKSQTRRVARKLCPSDTCTCGTVHGAQEGYEINFEWSRLEECEVMVIREGDPS